MSAYERFASDHGLVIGSEEEEVFASFATKQAGMHLYLLSYDEVRNLYERRPL